MNLESIPLQAFLIVSSALFCIGIWGLLNSRNLDQFIFYSLREEAMDIIDKIFNFLDKDTQLKEDLETYDIMYSNRELAINKIELKSWK